MARLPEFQLRRPASLVEAAALLAAEPQARLLAGGTDLLPNLRRGIEQPAMLVDLGAVPGFAETEQDEHGMKLGAGVTLAWLAADAGISGKYPAIHEAARSAAGPGHRSVATLGGNLCLDTRCVYYNQSDWWRAANGYCLKRGGDTCHVAPQGRHCHAAFSGDLAPALIALGAEVELVSTQGSRRVALVDCYRDDGAAHLNLRHDEVLACAHLPAPSPGAVSGYRKARVRGAMDFPLAGVACALVVRDGALAELRVALTGTNSRPLLLDGVQPLLGKPLDEASLNLLGKLVQKQVSPMRSTVTSSNYRRLVAAAHAQRLVGELMAQTMHTPAAAALPPLVQAASQ
jgi:4-hydroxybenzoyl-CoA reductase subunit beta